MHDYRYGHHHPRAPYPYELLARLHTELRQAVPAAHPAASSHQPTQLLSDNSRFWTPESVLGGYGSMLVWGLHGREPRRDIKPAERAAIAALFGWTCFYCDRRACIDQDPDGLQWAIDHYVPKARGGTCRPINLVLACRWCNDTKCAQLWCPGASQQSVARMLSSPPVSQVTMFDVAET